MSTSPNTVKYIVQAGGKLYKDLSFDESYKLFNELRQQQSGVTCYPDNSETYNNYS